MTSTNNSIRLVIFDWAGTTIDFGSRAPAKAFANVFSANGVDVTDEEARAPMGLNKREHLRTMLHNPAIADRWLSVNGREWTEADVDAMYEQFVTFQLTAIDQTSQLVPGLLEVVAELRAREIRVGGTTGYFRAAADAVAAHAAKAGFVPDENVCADDVPQGRPAPWMIHRIMERTEVYPPSCVLKVGDTVADIEAGLNAGCWSVGVCDSSSVVGLTPTQFHDLSKHDRLERLERAAKTFGNAGSHAVLGAIKELPTVIDDLNANLANGQRP